MATRDERVRFVYEVTGDKDVAAAAAAMLKAAEAGDDASEEVRAFAAELTKLSTASKSVGQLVKLKAELADTGRELDAARTKLSSIAAAFDAAAEPSARLTRQYEKAKATVATLEREYNRTQAGIARLGNVLRAAEVDTDHLDTAQAELADRAARTARSIGELATQTQRGGTFTRALKAATDAGAAGFAKLREGVNSFGASLLRITGIAGLVGTALAALNVGRLFGSSIASARDFESALSEVRAVSGASAEQLQRMRDAAEQASAATKFSALEAVQALGELARASGDADAAIAQLPATLNLAQGAEIDAAQAALILTTTLTQFGFAANDATRVADVFSREVNSTQDSMENLGNAMSYAAPLARQLGLSLEQTTALIGALAEQGFRGERAGTALRNVFGQLLDPASKFRDALRGLGIEGNDFASIIEQLAAAGGRGERALLSLEAQARPAIAALVRDGGAKIRSLTDDLKNSAGEAERTARIMGENFEGASSRLGNAFDALRRALIEPVFDPLAKQIDAAAERIRAFIQTADFKALSTSIGEFASKAVKAIMRFIETVDFKKVVDQVEGAIESFGKFAEKTSEHVEAIGRTFSVVGNTISLFWNGLQTVILGAAGVFVTASVKIQESVLGAARGIALLSGQSRQLEPAFKQIETRIGAMKAVADEFLAQAKKNAGETGDAFRGLSDAIAGTGDKAKDAAPKVAKVGEAAADSADEIKILGEVSTIALDKVGSESEAAAARSERLTNALSTLGLKSQQELQQAADVAAKALAEVQEAYEAGAATIEDVSRAFGVWAERSRAASADSSAAVRAQTEATIAARATALGLGDAYADSGDKAVAAAAKTARAFDGATGSISRSAAAVQEAALAADGVAESAQDAHRAYAALAGVQASFAAEFARTSQEASDRFNELVLRIYQGADAFSFFAAADTTGLARWAESITKASQRVQETIDGQRAGVAQLAAQYTSMGEAAIEALARQSGGFEEAAQRLDAMAAAAARGESGFDLLGQADLGPLQSGLAAAAARVRQLGEEALEAKAQIESIGRSIRDELDQIRGNDEAIEARRYAEQLERLRQLAEESGSLNASEYNDAVAAAKQLHEEKMRQIKEQAAARKKADEDAARAAANERKAAEAAQPAPRPSPLPQPGPSKLEILLNGRDLGVLENMTDAQVHAFARRIAPDLLRVIRTNAQTSGLGGYR